MFSFWSKKRSQLQHSGKLQVTCFHKQITAILYFSVSDVWPIWSSAFMHGNSYLTELDQIFAGCNRVDKNKKKQIVGFWFSVVINVHPNHLTMITFYLSFNLFIWAMPISQTQNVKSKNRYTVDKHDCFIPITLKRAIQSVIGLTQHLGIQYCKPIYFCTACNLFLGTLKIQHFTFTHMMLVIHTQEFTYAKLFTVGKMLKLIAIKIDRITA